MWKGNNAPQNIRRHPWYFLAYIIELFALSGAVATADDPSAAIATIQSAATFSSEHPIKYLFKTEGAGGQVGELYYPPAGQVQLGRAYSTGLTRSSWSLWARALSPANAHPQFSEAQSSVITNDRFDVSPSKPVCFLFLKVTYRVIQVSDGQLEAQSDGATAVSVLTGFPAATQPVTQVRIYTSRTWGPPSGKYWLK